MIFQRIRQKFCKHDFEGWETHEDPINGSRYRLRVYRTRECIKCKITEREPGYTTNYANDEASKLYLEVFKQKGILKRFTDGDMGSWWYCEFRTIVSDIFDDQGREAALDYINSVI